MTNNSETGDIIISEPQKAKFIEVETGKTVEKVQLVENVALLPLNKSETPAGIRKYAEMLGNADDTVIVCDFYVEQKPDILQDNAITMTELKDNAGNILGFSFSNRVINLDHHANHPLMSRQVSTANFAKGMVEKYGTFKTGALTMQNHTDTDSVISTAMLVGRIPPESIFVEAAIAADHTGAENLIADVLNPLEYKRDLAYSLWILELLRDGKPLPEDVVAGMEKRRQERTQAREFVLSGGLKKVGGGIYYAELDVEAVRAEFFPGIPELEDAKLIILSTPMGSSNPNLNVKTRLGKAGLDEGLNLNDLQLPYFGGRWNAGGTKRQTYSGNGLNGWNIPEGELSALGAENRTEAYARIVSEKLH